MLKPKSLSNKPASTQLTETQRRFIVSSGIKWFFAALAAFFDYSLNFIFLRIAFFVIPLSLPSFMFYCIDIGIMALGLFNCFTCFFAVFDLENIPIFGGATANSSSDQKPVAKKRDDFATVVVNLLNRSLYNVPSDYEPPTLQDYFTAKKQNDVQIIRRSMNTSIMEIFTDDQLAVAASMQPEGHTTFEPKYNKHAKFCYHKSIDYDEDDEDSNAINLNQSQIDLLDISEHYASHPDEHPLDLSKSKTSSSLSVRRGKSPGRISDVGPRLSSNRPRTTSSRSPRFLIAQKPVVTPVTKLFAQWKVDSQKLVVMTEDIRRFIARHIVIPLAQEIEQLNNFFASNVGTRNIVIGKTPLSDIEKVFGQVEYGKVVNLPYVLAYLRLNPNYVHLVRRLLVWSQSEYLNDFSPDSMTLMNNSWPETFPVSKTPLPTDSELIFSLFCFYMDNRCSLYPITYPFPCDLPFTHLHTLREGKKPSDAQLSSSGYYIEVSETQPINFKFYSSNYPAVVTPPTNNALIAILMLLVYNYGSGWNEVLNLPGIRP